MRGGEKFAGLLNGKERVSCGGVAVEVEKLGSGEEHAAFGELWVGEIWFDFILIGAGGLVNVRVNLLLFPGGESVSPESQKW